MQILSSAILKDGIILKVQKDASETVSSIISSLKKSYNTSIIGHNGTLDDFASGLMIFGINDGVNKIWQIETEPKVYLAELLLGVMTLTDDNYSQIIYYDTYQSQIGNEKIISTFEEFPETYIQTTPLQSANKINGIKSSKLSKNPNLVTKIENNQKVYFLGDKKLIRHKRVCDVKLQLMEITDLTLDKIHELSPEIFNKNSDIITDESLRVIKFQSSVSKGTYIRQLCMDIANNCGTVGCLLNLRRISMGNISLDDKIIMC